MSEKLPPKRAAFVREYLVDLNATQAAIRAGYSPKTSGSMAHDLLKEPEIQKAIQAGMDKRAARVELTADDVLAELLRLARVDVSKAFGPDGQLLPLKDIPEDVRRAISSIDTDEIVADGAAIGRVRRLRFWDKTKALDLLGRHLKLFTDKLEHTGPDGGPLQVSVSINGIVRE